MIEYIRGDFEILGNKTVSSVETQKDFVVGSGPGRYIVTKYIQTPDGTKYLPLCLVLHTAGVMSNLAASTTSDRKDFSDKLKRGEISLTDWLYFVTEPFRILTDYERNYSNFWYALTKLDSTFDLMGTYFIPLYKIRNAAADPVLDTASVLRREAARLIRPLMRNDLDLQNKIS